jgi:hypothetical protein
MDRKSGLPGNLIYLLSLAGIKTLPTGANPMAVWLARIQDALHAPVVPI